jgi:hypothetical protein
MKNVIDEISSLTKKAHRLATPERMDELDVDDRKVIDRALWFVPLETYFLVRELFEVGHPDSFAHRYRNRPSGLHQLLSNYATLASTLEGLDDDHEALLVSAIESLERRTSYGRPLLGDLVSVLEGPVSSESIERLASAGPSVEGTAAAAFGDVVHDERHVPDLAVLPLPRGRESRSIQRFGSTHDQFYERLSPQLRSDDPKSELERVARVQLLPGSLSLETEQRIEVAHAAMVAFRTMLPPALADIVSVSFCFSDEPLNEAAYLPRTQTVEVFASRYSPYFVLHELAHALDHQLATSSSPWFRGGGSRGGFAYVSNDATSPAGVLARTVRPAFHRVAREAGSVEIRTELERLLPEASWGLIDALLEQPVPVREVIEATGLFSRPEADSIVFELGRQEFRDSEIGHLQVDAIEQDWGVTFSDRPREFLLHVGAFVPLPGPGAEPRFDVGHYFEGWVRWWLQPAEIFARAVDQFLRNQLRREGLVFGPDSWPHDLDEADFALIEPMVKGTLESMAKTYEAWRQQSDATVRANESFAAAGVAVAAVAKGLGFVR